MMKRMVYFLLGIFLCGCISCSSRKQEPKALQLVKVATVVSNDQMSVSTFPGKVKAASDVNLSFKVSGGISHIRAVGTFVKKGEVLVEMDPRDYQLQFSATQAEYEQIKGECERVMALYEKNSVSKNDYEKALYGLQQITAKYNAHKNALEDTKLRAPFDGYVQKQFYHEGEIVGQGMPVLSMISSDALEVLIYIPMAEYMRRDKMKSFYATLDLLPEAEYPLAWIGLSPKANLNQLYALRLRVLPQKDKIMPTPEMPVMVHIAYSTVGEESYLIPMSALFGQDDGQYVWIYDSKTQCVQARKVTVADVLHTGEALITEGLQKGEQLVTAGVHSLSEGENVKLLPSTTSTNIGDLL